MRTSVSNNRNHRCGGKDENDVNEGKISRSSGQGIEPPLPKLQAAACLNTDIYPDF